MKTSSTFNRLAFLGTLAAAAISLGAATSLAFGDDIKVTLSGANEVPPVTTTASGSGTVTINPDMTVSGRVATKELAGTMAHIHIGAAGSNGPVIVHLSKDGDNAWVVPAGTKLSAPQYQAFQAGDLYVNIHSAAHKGGEIRGQLK